MPHTLDILDQPSCNNAIIDIVFVAERNVVFMDREIKKTVYCVIALFILALVGMLVTQQPAKTMMENNRPGSPFNQSVYTLIGW
jgi:hypothetical protein